MKTIILALTMLASTTVFSAQSKVVAQVSSVNQQVAAVQLTDSGMLSLAMRDRSVKSIRLSSANKEQMLWAAQALAQAEIETETRTMVCKMMIAPFMIQNLSVFVEGNRDLTLVLSYSSCALASYTHPKDAYMQDIAKTLKTQMLVLADQLVDSN